MTNRRFWIIAIIVAMIISAIITCNYNPVDDKYPIDPIFDHSRIPDSLGTDTTVFPIDRNEDISEKDS